MMNDAIPDLGGLLNLGARGLDIRATLLNVLTDLFVQRRIHSPQAMTHFTAIALKLLDTVPENERKSAARKLLRDPLTPLAIIARLGPDVAADEPERQQAGQLHDIFFSADAAERRLILLSLGTGTPPMPIVATSALMRLETLALGRNTETFARELERLLDVSQTFARRIVTDPSGEPLVVAAKALGCPTDVLHRILLFLNPGIGQSVQRVYALAGLYDEITPAAASEMIALWREAHPRRPAVPVHAPVYAHGRERATAPSNPASARPVAADGFGRRRA